MNKKQLILIPSPTMDNNKKKDRKEESLIRMTARVRDALGFDEDKVNIGYAKTNINLSIYKAFIEDIRAIKNMGFSDAEKSKIAFVTTSNYKKIVKENSDDPKKVWISKEEEEIVFGADPEFLIYKEDEIIPAFTLLNHIGAMGSDGAMGEVRPAPATSPEGLVKNIQQIFKSNVYEQIVKNYIFKAACYVKTTQRDYPVGGHIHIGNPIQILKLQTIQRERVFKTINKIMDELISVPLIKLDGKEQGKNRRVGCKTSSKGGYGFFGELRTAGSDQNFRLEHRTLSGMWLLHPTVATAVLGTAKAIIDEVWLRIATNEFDPEYAFPEKYVNSNIWKPGFDEWKNFPICKDFKCIESSDTLIKQLHESDPNFINKEFLDSWLIRMKKMSVYKKYDSYINLLYEILNVSSEELQKQDKIIQHTWIENKKFIIG